MARHREGKGSEARVFFQNSKGIQFDENECNTYFMKTCVLLHFVQKMTSQSLSNSFIELRAAGTQLFVE